VKFIHIGCLKQWIKSKGSSKINANCTTHIWKNLECELCHRSLPEVFVVKGQQVPLIDLPKPESNYIILETLAKDKGSSRSFHVISSLYNNALRIGRGHDCNIRINDISVSRCHAFIKMENGHFYLEDNSSKFGTLVLVKNSLVLNPDSTPSVQIGRTVVGFTVKTKTTPPSYQNANQAKSLTSFNNEVMDCDDYEKIEFSIHKKDSNKSKPLINIFEKLNLDNTPSTNKEPDSNPAKPNIKEDDFFLNTKFYNLKLDKPEKPNLFESIDYKSYFSFNKLNINDENVINDQVPSNNGSDSEKSNKDEIVENNTEINHTNESSIKEPSNSIKKHSI